MYSNRISQFLPGDDVQTDAPVPAPAAPSGFVIVPVAFFAVGPMQAVPQQPDIYRIAREQAQADVRWSHIQKRLFSVWN